MPMRNITTDVEGIIRELNISESNVLYPFYEAVVNSIQAIGELKSSERGKISIEIRRDTSEQLLFEECQNYPIESIKIIDTGIGFTKENYESFGRAHSTKKAHLGGKGLGRFAILSVFDNIEVKSIRKGTPNELISFTLSRSEGLSDTAVIETSDTPGTEIILSNINSKFKRATALYSHEDIADKILAHCLLYYLSGNVPYVEIIENDDVIILDNQFNPTDFVKYTASQKIGDYDFKLYYVKNDKIRSHEYCFCSHNRKVKSKKLETVLPIFSSKIDEDGESYFIQIYVVSEYLDSIVNMARNELRFPRASDDTEQLTLGTHSNFQPITERDVDNLVRHITEERYKEVISGRREGVKVALKAFLSTDEGLEYRHLHLDNEFYQSIPDDVDAKKFDDLLHDFQYKRSIEARRKRERLLSRNYSNKKEYQDLLQEYVSLTTEENNSRLAQYVSHRKTIISLLERYLEWSEEHNNYEEESVLHNLIYTMGGTQDTIAYDKHNLWLLDDRLTFHRYIYSDKQIRLQKPVEETSESQKETDLAIYDIPFVYGEKNDYDEINSVVIFEFKRPDRTVSYEEFSKQMRDQIFGIRDGKLKDDNQRHIQSPENTPIFFYYVCDSNAYTKLKKSAILEGFVETPYKSIVRFMGQNIHQEILTYQTLIVNAKRRNKIFFKKLGLE